MGDKIYEISLVQEIDVFKLYASKLGHQDGLVFGLMREDLRRRTLAEWKE